MAKFSKYNIPLKSLQQGTYAFEYELNRKFFEDIDGDEVKKGDVKVKLILKKTSTSHELNFELKGVIQIPCDRCLDDMDFEIDSRNRLIVKFGEDYSEESDEIVIIPEVDGEINIAWFLYEFIALEIPIKHVHPQGECNRTMTSKLRKHRAVSLDDDNEEEDLDNDLADDYSDDNGSEITDSRWDALKGLNFEDN